MTNRREFLKGVAMSAGNGIVAGCVCAKGTCGGVSGAPMRNFRCAPMKDGVRVGVVGIGARGIGAVSRLMMVPGVTVTAVCEIRAEYAEQGRKAVQDKTGVRPLVFSGAAEAYKRLCDSPKVDVVYNCTSWDAHVPIAVYAMKAGKHALVEVPSAMFVEECWELVETAEATPRPYSRLNLIAGTKGVFRSYPRLDIFVEGKNEWPTSSDGHKFTDEMTACIKNEFQHPLYKQAGEIAKKVGGHGGMDYLMDLRWAYCIQNGLLLDTDVYDLASWCAISELTERSTRNRSQAMDIPDFTRGAWKVPSRCNLMDATVDVSKMNFKSASAAAGQLSV